MSCDALITYSWNRVGYGILRNLTDYGLKVITADTSRYNICSMSNRVQRSFIYADPFSHPDRFISDLRVIIEKNRPRVLFPTHEETFIIAKYRDRLPADISIPLMDFPSLMLAHDKISASRIAERTGVPVPKIYRLKDKAGIKKIRSKLQYPVVVKLSKSNAAKGVYYAHSYSELDNIISTLFHARSILPDRVFLQDYVYGTGYGASFLYDRGRMVTGFVHKRLTEKTHTGGVSTRRVSVKNDRVLKYGKKILDHMKWHGVAMVEFKHNEQEDRTWFIEINPRYWGSLWLPIAAGLPIPYWHYCIATGTPFKVNGYKEGVVSQWILGGFITLIERAVSRKLSWKELGKLLNFRADNYDDLKKDDLRAFLGENIYYLAKFLRTGKLNPDSNQTTEY